MSAPHQPFQYDPPLMDLVEFQRGVLAAQGKALAHWRREADRDAGEIRRQHDALFRIAFGSDSLEDVRHLAREALVEELP